MPKFACWMMMPILALLAGCGGSGPKYVPVDGAITLDGKPLPLKNIQFIPEPGTPGIGAGGNSSAEGTYKLLAVKPGSTVDVYGVPPGKYRVVVAEPMFPIDAKMPEANGTEPVVAVGLPTEPKVKPEYKIPAKYSSAETTPLVVDVPPEGGTIALTLNSK